MNARLIRCAMTGLVLVVTGGSSIAGCLDRPVVPGEPTTKTNFTTSVAQAAVDKLDILFSIDNSASMGDKQAYLEQAIPDLISRLVTPNCVDDTDPNKVNGVSTVTNGVADCSSINPPSQPEFPAVHDMHIGVVSSSLGPRLGDKQPADGSGGECAAAATITINGVTLNNHYDDQAHLLTRSSDPTIPVTGAPTEVPLADAASGFLAWYPSSNTGSPGAGITPVTNIATLKTDFADLIAGVHEYGCGIESQLENWYRFLIQPDPYASLALVNGKAAWVGVDTTILKQRHDFLRPDSLVAVIVLTDENDSEIDVRSIGGQGYLFMSTKFYPPHGTAACTMNGPADPGCTTQGAADKSPYNGTNDWGYDLNLRHVHMQQKYGLNPQFPIGRYVNGLTQPTVPDRNGEYPGNAANYSGAVPDGKGGFVGNAGCTNPLFAASLPDGSGLSGSVATNETSSDATTLCNLKPSVQRSKSLVFYAIIGGVPWQLLHFDPTSPSNSLLTASDWTRILGNNPDTYDYSGIDPHMVESYAPRGPTQGYNLLPAPTVGTSAAETNPAPATGGNTDPWNGREWTTNAGAHLDLPVDREYACIFKLTTPRDCSRSGNPPTYNVPANGFACDCSSTGLAPDQLSPVCDPANPNSQTYAKAYPTIRELNLANKLGTQGIVSSICPIDVADNTGQTDPLYGYRPAVASIVSRLKSALANQCLPQQLNADATGTVPCLILATLPQATPANVNNPQADCTSGKYPGYSAPDPQILAQFQAQAEQVWTQGGGAKSGAPEPKTLPTCQVAQFPPAQLTNGSCKTSAPGGWCYVTGQAAGTCAQAIVFSPQTIPNGATINLQCIESSSALAAGDGG